MKKITALLLAGATAFAGVAGLAGCGETTSSEAVETTAETEVATTAQKADSLSETDHMKVTGMYVDNSYTDEANENLKLVYVFYDVFTNDTNFKCASSYGGNKMKINDLNEYFDAHIPGVCTYMDSYEYSNSNKEIYIGDSKKFVTTFKVPGTELEKGRKIALTIKDIPDADKLNLTTDMIVFCNSAEEIALAADPEGYKNYLYKNEYADEETEEEVRSFLNGNTIHFNANSTMYHLSFYDPNYFELTTTFGTNGGTYEVKNGYVSITYDSNDATVDIPWEYDEDGNPDLDVNRAFDVKKD